MKQKIAQELAGISTERSQKGQEYGESGKSFPQRSSLTIVALFMQLLSSEKIRIFFKGSRHPRTKLLTIE